MKKTFITLFILILTVCTTAQTVRMDFDQNIGRSGSNLLAYETPEQTRTQAPAGKKPFYISHYGRHGSRYLISPQEYNEPYNTLLIADSLKKLTPLGKDVLERILILKNEANKRLGELTPLGAIQHRQIAERMYKHYPEVFVNQVTIDAKSTIVIRCILSMENELLELARLNPRLNILSDASEHDMYYMNLTDTALNRQKMPPLAKAAYEQFYNEHVKSHDLMKRLFNDMTYVNNHINEKELNKQLFNLASSVQNVESRSGLTLYDIFTSDELYNNWRVNNAWWYINYGNCPLNGGTQPYSQRNLLKRIIEQADSCIRLPHPGATLRFGHETMVLPLVCLLNLNNYGEPIDDLNLLERKGWINYRIFPMAANIQFIFYRKDINDKDVLVKVLLNEKEASLPLQSNVAPYYHWKDVRTYYLDKLQKFKHQQAEF